MTKDHPGIRHGQLEAGVSVMTEDPRLLVSKIDDFAGVALTDINASALDTIISQIISELPVKPIQPAAFGSAI